MTLEVLSFTAVHMGIVVLLMKAEEKNSDGYVCIRSQIIEVFEMERLVYIFVNQSG